MTLAILSAENIVLNQVLTTKEDAIRLTGKILVDRGYVEPSYVEKMLGARGNDVDIHGQLRSDSTRNGRSKK